VLDNLNRRQRIFPDDKRSSMSFFHITKSAAVLLFPLFCAEPFFAQEKPPHACFEQPNPPRPMGSSLDCIFTVQKPYVIELSGLTSSEKQIPRNCWKH